MRYVRYRFLFILFILLFTYTGPAFPVTADVQQGVNFGTIIANPAGADIEIDARLGPATPVMISGAYSHVDDNGYSGIVRVRSDAPGQTITLLYPASVILDAVGLDTMTYDFISDRSENSALSIMADEDIFFDIGGRLHIGNGQRGLPYSGNMTITIDVMNP